MDRLIVDGIEINLDPNKRIGYTVYGVNLSDITKQKTSYSNRVKIPLTDHNREALGYPEEISSGDRTPYRLLPCSLWLDGFQVVTNGLLKIERISDDIEATVFSGDLEAFKLMKGLELKDLDLSSDNHFYTMAEISSRANNFLGAGESFYPAINYKKNPVTSNRWNYNYLFPAWWVLDILNQAFTDQGYKVGSLEWVLPGFQVSHVARLAIPFSNKKFQNGAAYVTDHSFNAVSNASTVVDIDYENNSGTLETPVYTDKVAAQVEETGNANYSSPDFTEPNASRIRYYGEFRVSAFTHSYQDTPPEDPPLAFYRIAIVKNGVMQSETQIGADNSLSLATYSIEAEVEATAGDEISLAFLTYIESSGIDDEVTVDATLEDVKFYAANVEAEIFPGGYVESAEQLPEIEQTDFIRYIGSLIGAYIVTDPISKKWTYKPFKDIVAQKPAAKNWDSKLVLKPGQENWYVNKDTKPESFYQVNKFEWLADETVNPVKGNGSFNLDNEQLDKTGTFIDNIFSASEQRLTAGAAGAMSLVYIDKWDDDDKPNDIGSRIVLIDEGNTLSIQLTDADSGGAAGPSASYYPAKFEEPGLEIGGLGWDRDLRSRYWEELITALNNFVEVEVYLRLDPGDIADIIRQYQGAIDPIIPVYLKGEYWIIKQVKSYRSDDFTKVILTKV